VEFVRTFAIFALGEKLWLMLITCKIFEEEAQRDFLNFRRSLLIFVIAGIVFKKLHAFWWSLGQFGLWTLAVVGPVHTIFLLIMTSAIT
jgi:hypothetical protein